jgi:hypothetical protein
MRNLIAAALSFTLIASSAMAADQAGSLAPGQPAGVKQAQEDVNTTALLVIGGIVVIGAIIGITSASDGNPPNMVSPSTVSTSAP